MVKLFENLHVMHKPLEIDSETKEFVESLEDIISLYCVRREDEQIIVMGEKKDTPIEIVKNIHSGLVQTITYKDSLFTQLFRSENPNEGKFYSKLYDLREKNEKDIVEKIKHIEVYQGSLNDIYKLTGKKLRLVDVEGPNKFIHEKIYSENDPTFLLRLKSYLLGANAIINYQELTTNNVVIGTPVKYVKK